MRRVFCVLITNPRAVQISLTGLVRTLQNHSIAVFPTDLEPSESGYLPAVGAKFVERLLGAFLELLIAIASDLPSPRRRLADLE
jgi:hypothetical protein